MKIDIDKLEYIIWNLGFEIDRKISNVLEDSIEDPHCSAVHTSNLIKCYIQLKDDIGQKEPYDSIKGYFAASSFSNEEYEEFERKRKKESEYYIGEQF